MARNRRRLRHRRHKNDLQECLEICLAQKRHDALGNRVLGYDFEQILAMTPAERSRVKQSGWLGEKSNRRG